MGICVGKGEGEIPFTRITLLFAKIDFTRSVLLLEKRRRYDDDRKVDMELLINANRGSSNLSRTPVSIVPYGFTRGDTIGLE